MLRAPAKTCPRKPAQRVGSGRYATPLPGAAKGVMELRHLAAESRRRITALRLRKLHSRRSGAPSEPKVVAFQLFLCPPDRLSLIAHCGRGLPFLFADAITKVAVRFRIKQARICLLV